MTLPGCNLIEEQSKDKELVQIKETVQNGKATQSVNSKSTILDDILYYLSKTDTDDPAIKTMSSRTVKKVSNARILYLYKYIYIFLYNL